MVAFFINLFKQKFKRMGMNENELLLGCLSRFY